ncbi:MAG: hypothetical protein E7242_01595 [Lachnospiraceae bacterium]|nr:hypothetical protein [Lachnospiraceae bacterium]
MRRRETIFDKTWVKIAIIAAAVFVVVLIYVISHSDKIENKTEIMGDETLPVVKMLDAGEYLNTLYGYTNDMDAQFMRGTISVIDENYEVHFKISGGSRDVKGISYELRSLDATGLVDSAEVKTYEKTDDGIDATIKFDNVMEDEKEYTLVITLATDEGNVNYYTRVVKDADITLAAQLEYIKNFHNMTFDKENMTSLFKYLETDTGDVDKNNLGHVNIYSHYYQVSWGDMNPTRIGDAKISIIELDNSIGSYKVNYQVSTELEGNYEIYNVTEYYRVRVDEDGQSFMLYFDRTMDQIFDGNENNIFTKSILLGIDSDLTVDFATSENGKFAAFINQGALWLLDFDDDKATKVFSFEDENSTKKYLDSEYSIDIINLDDEGNMDYIVYGYMNKGSFEGQVGIAPVKYNYENNENKVVGFVPTTQSYEILNTLVGDLYYLNSSNVLYVVLDNSLYSVDLEGHDSVQVATGLAPGNFVVSTDNKMIAWHKDNGLYQTETIIVLNMESGLSYNVNAPEGKVVSAEGFLDEDIVYGVGTAGNLYTDANGQTTLLKEDVYVEDENNEVQKAEEGGSIYFANSKSLKGRILFTRLYRDSLANYNDLAIYASENDTEAIEASTTYVEIDENKRKQIYFTFPGDGKFNVTPLLATVEKTEFTTTETLSVSNIIGEQNKYYVYALGKITGVYDDISTAIVNAYNEEGVVVNRSGNYAWQRISRPTKVTLSDSAAADIFAKYQAGSLVQVSGVNLKQMLYYTGVRKPIVVTGDGFTYVITGYNPQNYLLWSEETGTSKYMASDDGDALFAGATYFVEIK